MTHLHFLKLSSEHLKFDVLDLLGSFVGGLKKVHASLAVFT